MAGNGSLAKAKDARQDEFYTQLTDIEKELRHYRKHFAGKTVLCNCDDPFESNFFKYFALNFNRLGLKKLVATCYSGSPITGTQLPLFGDETEEERRTPYRAVVTSVHDANGNGGVEMEDVAELFRSGENTIERLEGNGSYDSPECLELLDEADVVATNPPFSKFREYVSTLLSHEKKFVVIGSQNAITYKEIFPLLQGNKIWLGCNTGDMAFRVPDSYEPRETRYWQDENGQKWRSMGNICWFTNLDLKKRHEQMILVRRFDSERYPTYENFDGIDVDEIAEIPCDFSGVMGVPLTFMSCFSPDQFEIVGFGKGNLAKQIGVGKNHRGRTDIEFRKPDGSYKCPYGRVLVRNLHPEKPKEA